MGAAASSSSRTFLTNLYVLSTKSAVPIRPAALILNKRERERGKRMREREIDRERERGRTKKSNRNYGEEKKKKGTRRKFSDKMRLR